MTKFSSWKMAGAAFLLCAATAVAAPAQTFNTLFNMHGQYGEGPEGPLVQGIDGAFYGATQTGAKNDDGTIFRITSAGNAMALPFNAVDGATPQAGLILGTDGNFYGTTYLGGTSDYGTVFRVSSSGKLTTLHNFCPNSEPCDDGALPYAALVEGKDGQFYGTTYRGGASSSGAVFRISPTGTLSVLHSFDITDGRYPRSSLIQATDGNFYGTTSSGGDTTCDDPDGCGTVFKITSSGTFTTLHNFEFKDGAWPYAGLIQGSNGNFYGTTWGGGSIGMASGTVFEITPGGALTTLYFFGGGLGSPMAGLMQGTDGNFYGTTPGDLGGPLQYGTVFNITPEGTLTTLHYFDWTDGTYPTATLLQATTGVFYGATLYGGDDHCAYCGTVFSINMGLGPFVAFISDADKVGQRAQILGQGFTGTTSVSFNGTPADFTVVSDTFLRATVPAGATTGYVTVTTPSGTLTSNVPFDVIP